MGSPAKLIVRRAAVALAIAVAAPLAAQQSPAPAPLRVVTFNIRYGTAADGPDAWPNRRDALIAWMSAAGADVIGLQEALRFQLDEITAAMPAHALAGVGRDDGVAAGEHAAILYRAERFQRLDGGTFWFSDTPAVPGSVSWGNRITRICTWVRLRDRASGATFYVYNVHLDHESQPSRERSVAALLDSIAGRADRTAPVLVTGDFNAGEDNPAVRVMAELFQDTWRRAHPFVRGAGTFNGFRDDSTGEKIDYIFADTSWRVVAAAIERPRTGDGRHLSDHFPVLAHLAPGPPPPAAAEAARAGELEGITVTATRVERRVEDQVMRVEVVEPEEVEEKVLMTPGDITMLLNETGGLRVVATAPSLGGASVRVHGLPGRYTQVLADGLPLYGPTGSLGLLQIPPVDLLQVEIVKGPASAEWGGGGLGGLVNLVSRRPDGGRSLLVNATTLGGVDGVFFGSGFSGAATGWSLLAGAHRQGRADRDDDGWTDVAGYERVTLRPRLFWTGGEGRELFATAGVMAESREGGTLRGALAPDSQAFREAIATRRVDGGVRAGTRTAGGVSLGLRAAGMMQWHEQWFGTAREEDRHGTALLEATAARLAGAFAWAVGAAWESEQLRSTTTPVFDFTHVVPGVFASAEWTPRPGLGAGVSARADHHSEYGWQLNPRLSLRAPLRGTWAARFSAGTGSRGPTPFTEATEEVGLTALEPVLGLRVEHALAASLDVGGFVRGVELNLTLFASRVDRPVGAIVVTPSGGGQPPPGSAPSLRLVNASGPLIAEGVDAVARWRREPWHVAVSWTVLRSRETDDSVRRDVPLNPELAGGAVMMYEALGWKAGLELYYTGRQALGAGAPRPRSRAYGVVGFLIQREVGRATVFVNFENIGDTRVTRFDRLVNPAWEPATGWTGDAWAPAEGRVVNGGVKLRLGR